MARVGNPWRAMTLASVIVLAACEPGVGVVAPLDSATTAESSVSVDTQADVELKVQRETAVTPVVGSGLENLVVMTGPASTDGILGAGCSPEDSENLPDGDWFGFVLGANTRALTVDIACVYGPDTEQFQAYSATDDSRWANYVVVNDVVEELSLPYRTSAQAYLAVEDWQPREVRDLVANPAPEHKEGARGVWLRIEEGQVVAIVQPYTKGVASD